MEILGQLINLLEFQFLSSKVVSMPTFKVEDQIKIKDKTLKNHTTLRQ